MISDSTLKTNIREGTYELLVLEEETSLDAGIPRCQRLPGARTGDWLNYLVPIKDLPRCGSGKGFCGKINIYLRSNEFAKEGRVTVSRSWPFEQIESGAISLEDLTGPEAQQGAQASLVASREIMVTKPSLYFIGRIKIPKSLPDGTRVTRGMYSIAVFDRCRCDEWRQSGCRSHHERFEYSLKYNLPAARMPCRS
jgi:hypothetical protein